ncbi:MAG: hypothetical protein WC582_01240 [Patescibacteria group bacterium]|jgi:hypothetical protein
MKKMQKSNKEIGQARIAKIKTTTDITNPNKAKVAEILHFKTSPLIPVFSFFILLILSKLVSEEI